VRGWTEVILKPSTLERKKVAGRPCYTSHTDSIPANILLVLTHPAVPIVAHPVLLTYRNSYEELYVSSLLGAKSPVLARKESSRQCCLECRLRATEEAQVVSRKGKNDISAYHGKRRKTGVSRRQLEEALRSKAMLRSCGRGFYITLLVQIDEILRRRGDRTGRIPGLAAWHDER